MKTDQREAEHLGARIAQDRALDAEMGTYDDRDSLNVNPDGCAYARLEAEFGPDVPDDIRGAFEFGYSSVIETVRAKART